MLIIFLFFISLTILINHIFIHQIFIIFVEILSINYLVFIEIILNYLNDLIDYIFYCLVLYEDIEIL